MPYFRLFFASSLQFIIDVPNQQLDTSYDILNNAFVYTCEFCAEYGIENTKISENGCGQCLRKVSGRPNMSFWRKKDASDN